ncbi:hypothetical protein [Geomicrobium sp. JCM 19055]|uniref:hypothetical protein n=1 Tax=Geomicrobium sp. JCM 19055 TaxID=1460649 RepID=UPI002236BC27|nr:hypothetical protein [Geomicrobium sp. JCM 19055]
MAPTMITIVETIENTIHTVRPAIPIPKVSALPADKMKMKKIAVPTTIKEIPEIMSV